MAITAQSILDLGSTIFTDQAGNRQAKAAKIIAPGLAAQDGLTFVSSADEIAEALKNQAAIILAPSPLPQEIQLPDGVCLISYKDRSLAMSYVLPLFHEELSWNSGIHATAVVALSAEVADEVEVGPYAVIGEGVKIGRGARIGPHCITEKNAVIGDQTVLQAQVFIGWSCQVGKNCRIQSQVTIGTDGYGYATTKEGHRKIPQIGIVVIEDEVEIGSHTAVDRATIHETRIGRGTKLDNLVHIAHNCQVGKYCFITAGFATAGSTTFGDYFACGGGVRVGGHLTIAPGVQLAGATVVRQSIDKPGQYGGDPAQPMKDFIRTAMTLTKLPEMRRQLSKVIKG